HSVAARTASHPRRPGAHFPARVARTHRAGWRIGERTIVAKFCLCKPASRTSPITKVAAAARPTHGATLFASRKQRNRPWLAHVGLRADARSLFAPVAPRAARLRTTDHARFHLLCGAQSATVGALLPRFVR